MVPQAHASLMSIQGWFLHIVKVEMSYQFTGDALGYTSMRKGMQLGLPPAGWYVLHKYATSLPPLPLAGEHQPVITFSNMAGNLDAMTPIYFRHSVAHFAP